MAIAEAEAVMVGWLSSAFEDVRICTELPANLADVLPCVRVNRIGGNDEEIYTFDNPTVDFDCYAATREAARTLAYAVRTSIRDDLPGQIVAGAVASRVRTVSGPSWTPYDNTSLRRFTFTAQIRLHSLEP